MLHPDASDRDAQVRITVYFEDREPVGPYAITVLVQRTKHLRFNALDDPEPVPRGTPYASVIESDVPVVVQHTRLDSRQAEKRADTTIAYAGGRDRRRTRDPGRADAVGPHHKLGRDLDERLGRGRRAA